MKLTYKLTELDRKNFLKNNFTQNKKTSIKIVVFVIWIFMLTMFSFSLVIRDYFIAAIYLGLIIFALLIPRINKKIYLKKIDFDEIRTVEINDSNLVTTSKSRHIAYSYSEIKNVRLINNYFVVIDFKPGDSIAIPDSAFDSEDEKIEFINQLKLKSKVL